MSPLKGHINHTIVRILIVCASGIAAGFLFYGSLIFIPTMVPFQFTYSSITASLFYGFQKSSSLRNALLAVLVWYAASTLIDVKNSSMLVLCFAYVAGISVVVYLYLRLIHRPVLNGVFQRVATFSLLTGTVNLIIAVALTAFWAALAGMSFHRVPQIAVDNFQIGTLIGLGIGAGIEIAEYILAIKSFRQFIQGIE
jgi:hypothetical protein